jgi:predicted transcriptional regulator
MQSLVGELMDGSFPVVEVDASLNDVTRGLHRSPAILVEEYKRIVGIITRHDVLETPANAGR